MEVFCLPTLELMDIQYLVHKRAVEAISGEFLNEIRTGILLLGGDIFEINSMFSLLKINVLNTLRAQENITSVLAFKVNLFLYL